MTERTKFDRFLAAIPVAVVALSLLALFFWEAATRKTPTIFSDELEWTQISRAIASTGHAARRGTPVSFKSLYAFMIAPWWWIHSTATAYSLIKYFDTVVMCLAAVPAYLLAKMLVPQRVAIFVAFASICTSALFYAGFLLPEVVAYPTFIAVAYVCVRALAGGGKRWMIAAVVSCVIATQVRDELETLFAAFLIAAVVLWIAGPTSRRLRRGWGRLDYVGASLLGFGALVLLNRIISSRSAQYAVVTQTWPHRMWSLGFQAGSAFALGLGVLPAMAGLASLWLPSRRHDPAWRAFAAFTASAIFTVSAYTAIKAAFNSTVFATRVEERNMIYLGPLLIVGAAVYFTSRRPWLPGFLISGAFVTWLLTAYGYQLDYPYFESPGYGIAAFANRVLHWDQPTIRTALYVTCAVCFVVAIAHWSRAVPSAVRNGLLATVALAAVAWMLTAEITSARGSEVESTLFVAHLPKPLDWVDQATHGKAVTFLGQDIGDPDGEWELEFWNRSIKHVWSLDATAPPPGPVLTLDLTSPDGSLSHDPGFEYVVTTSNVELIGQTVKSQPGLDLVRLRSHPWRLKQLVTGLSSDGWIGSDGSFAYFGPERRRGTVAVTVGRTAFCSPTAPKAHVTISVGPVALNEQRKPIVAHVESVRRLILPNCVARTVDVPATPPFVAAVHVTPTVRPSDYGLSDTRELGAQTGWTFTPGKG